MWNYAVTVVLTAFSVRITSVPCTQQSSGSVSQGVLLINNLDADLYVWSVSTTDGPLHIIAGNGGSYSEPWQSTVDGTGVSIKIATQNDKEDVLQFEYSAIHPTVWWDVSCINLSKDSAIIKEGFSATPNISECPSVFCAPGDISCPDVYYEPDDNYAVRPCSVKSYVVVKIGM